MTQDLIHAILSAMSLPQVGLISIFVISLISATLVPLGSEPIVFAFAKTHPDLFWQAILIATLGNTLGGVIDYCLGWGAKRAFASERETIWFKWLKRFGAKALLLAWLPVIGDPICTLAGWLRLPFWASVGYMALGKCFRYLTITFLLMHVPDGTWHQLAEMFG